MKNKAKAIIKTGILSVVVIALAYVYSHVDKNSYLYDRNTDTFNSIGVLEGNGSIQQTFVAQDKSIDGVNIKVTSVGDVEDVVVHYSLVDKVTGDTVTQKVAAKNLKSNKFNYLELPTVQDAKGKTFTVIFTAENADEENGIIFYTVPVKKTNHKLHVDGEQQEGILAMRTVCHRFDTETFVVLLGIVVFVVLFMRTLYKSFR